MEQKVLGNVTLMSRSAGNGPGAQFEPNHRDDVIQFPLACSLVCIAQPTLCIAAATQVRMAGRPAIGGHQRPGLHANLHHKTETAAAANRELPFGAFVVASPHRGAGVGLGEEKGSGPSGA